VGELWGNAPPWPIQPKVCSIARSVALGGKAAVLVGHSGGCVPQYLRLALQAEREIVELLSPDEYDAGSKEAHINLLAEATAEETDFEEEFGDEDIR